MSRSLRLRVVVWFVALTALLLAIFSTGLYLAARQAAYGALDDLLQARAEACAALTEYEALVQRFDFEPSPSMLSAIRAEEPYRGLEIYDLARLPAAEAIFRSPVLSSGATLLERLNAAGAFSGGTSPLPRAVNATLALRDGTRIRLHAGVYRPRVEDEEDQERAQAHDRDDGPSDESSAAPTRPDAWLLILVAEQTTAVESSLRRLGFVLAVALPLAILVACLFGWLLSARIVGPISAMADAAAAIHSSAPSGRVPVSGTGDEIDQLGQALNDAFERLSSALERQSQFTADAAHELRTPLTVIRTQSEVALRTDRPAEEYRRALERVLEGSWRAGETLDGLLILARADSGGLPAEAELLDLSQLCEDLANESSPRAAERGLKLSRAITGTILVPGDRRLLRIAIENLMSNALRHSDPPASVVLRLHPSASEAVIEVEDQGPGIAAQHLAHVFEPFYRVDPSRTRRDGGSGLGLSIVRAVAEQHGGSVTIESVPGRGTKVALSLPRALQDPADGIRSA